MAPSSSFPRFRFRRAADFTALHLGRAVLGYLALTTAIITLAPFRFERLPAHGLTSIWTWSDLVMNVLMFVPFGFVYQLTRPRGAPPDWPRVAMLGALLSGSIEFVQLFAPTRYSSLLDVATNTAGAALGSLLFGSVTRRIEGDAAVQSLALELPLMGLVYLLVPLAWLLGLGSEGDDRRLLLLVLTMIAGAIVGTVHAAYMTDAKGEVGSWEAGNREAGNREAVELVRWLVALPLGWVLVAVVPAARGDWWLVAAAVGLVLPTAWLRDRATTRLAARGSRRFELPTLRLVLPLFAAYLACSALWPLTGATPEWRASVALTLPDVVVSQPLVYRLLEHVAAFTLVGYIGAEFHGRDERHLVRTLPRLLLWTASVSALLEAARGFHAAYGASLSLFLISQVAAVFGAYVYVLQRAHVRALVKRRELLASMEVALPAAA